MTWAECLNDSEWLAEYGEDEEQRNTMKRLADEDLDTRLAAIAALEQLEQPPESPTPGEAVRR